MTSVEEVRDALLERIAYHAVSADVDDVVKLAKAWELLVDSDDDDDDDEDEDDD